MLFLGVRPNVVMAGWIRRKKSRGLACMVATWEKFIFWG